MKSYRITSVVIAALAASAAFADLPKDLKDLSPQERRQVLLERRKANAKPTGGLLERPSALPSKIISVDNSQKALDDAVISPLVAAARRTTRLPLELNGTNRVAITIEISKCEKLPALGIFPEEKKAIVTVVKLSADGPSAELLSSRIEKEIVRAALMVLGSGYSPTVCYATPVFSLADLDKMKPRNVSPDTMMHIPATSRLGIQTISYASYRKAVEEGWAPAPTNDVQRTIMQEIDSAKERSPVNGLKIAP